MTGPRIIVALDYPNAEQALKMADRLDANRCRLKVGKELFTRSGPGLVENLVAKGYDVFLDLKFHDIPNTVAQACTAAADLGVWMVNVHALGGRKMMEAASNAIKQASHKPMLIAVTILTSLSDEDLKDIGLNGTSEQNVLRLATLAKSSGMDGIVCSPLEVSMLRKSQGKDFRLVISGIRFAGAQFNDQQRIMTPGQVIAVGSDYLVIGRPITAASDPLEALESIEREINSVINA